MAPTTKRKKQDKTRIVLAAVSPLADVFYPQTTSILSRQTHRESAEQLLTSWGWGLALRASHAVHEKVHAVGVRLVQQVPHLHGHFSSTRLAWGS